MNTTCHTHLILLDSITLMIFGEAYRLFGSSLQSLLLPLPVRSLILDTLNLCSWEADNHSPKVHFYVHNSLPLAPILSDMPPVHTFPLYFHKICSNIFPSMPRSYEFSSQFSNKNITCISQLSHAYYMPHPSPPWFYHPNNIRWSIKVMKPLIMQHSTTFHHPQPQCTFFL